MDTIAPLAPTGRRTRLDAQAEAQTGAQAQDTPPAPGTPCGDGPESNWLCELVLRETGNETLAQASGVGTTLISVTLILVGAFVLSRLLRRGVNRFASRMEGNIEDRLERAIERGALSDTQRFRTRRLQRL